ncbi:MAG: hypothetical protein H0U39_10485 [Segetibacter sp.]|nr:hypothetical protein [Segetibacter sp.]
MSQAFVKESEEQWLHEIAPTINALIVYLTRENNNIRVYEKKSYVDEKPGKEVIEMSNGVTYAKVMKVGGVLFNETLLLCRCLYCSHCSFPAGFYLALVI